MLHQAIAMSEPVAAKDVLILAHEVDDYENLITSLIEPQAPQTPVS